MVTFPVSDVVVYNISGSTFYCTIKVLIYSDYLVVISVTICDTTLSFL